MRKREVMIVGLTLAFFGSARGPVGAATLEMNRADVVARALDRDLALKKAEHAVETAREGVRAAHVDRRPDWTLQMRTRYFDNADLLGEVPGSSTSQRHGYTHTAGMSVDTRLFDWMKNTRIIRNRRAQELQAELDLETARLDTIGDALRIYYTVLLNKRTLESNEDARRAAELHREEVEDLFSSGKVSHSELLDARVSLTNAVTDVVNSRKALNAARADLQRLLDLPFDEDVALVGNLAYAPVDLDAGAILAAVLQGNPALRRLRLQEEIDARSVRVEGAQDYPSVAMVGYYTYQDFIGSPSVDAYTVGLSVDLPLGRGTLRRDGMARARRTLWETRREIARQEQFLRRETRRLLADLEADRTIIESQGPNIDLARENLRVCERDYKNGKGRSRDVAEARESLTTAETAYHRAVFNYIATLIDLARLEGRDPRGLLPRDSDKEPSDEP